MELLEHLRTVRLVDHHVHGWFTEPGDRAAFEAALNEGSPGPVSTGFDLPIGVAVRRWCAPLLGLPPLVSADAYWEARSATPYDELVGTFLGAAGVDQWLVDTGLTPGVVTNPVPMSEVVRLETLLEEALGEDDPVGAFRERLDAAARTVVATKTIAAYRCGLDIDWARPSDAEVGAAARRSAPRVTDPVLVAFAVHEAAERGLPLQVHTGLGDRDLDLHRADPMLLLPLLRSIGSPVLLLHCYPFHRQAGYLAQAFDHVHFDVGLAVSHLGARSVELVAEAMELAPFGKQLYSSDAYGLPELHALGSLLWRRAMGEVLGGWVARGDWSEADAVAVVDLVAAGNARRVYGL
ncbi:amidohydrolase family protein [Nocardioides mangrovi]|uniref:Amidohydrolase family protein n=1 Tax=Nocardioides mangrovi TaxID=2874580 RepID=A0ABS7UGG0_9ACTN|nr:amidohydrolase family protein [Nocardioides mangrovi]MBZ5739919.1 amidohydrolase family protein [Nocardioides mangrovi]